MVAEDDWCIAQMIREILLDLGCIVIGPFRKLDEVMHAIHANGVDGALLDVQLGKESVHPAAQELALRDIPFILVTGQRSLDGSLALAGNVLVLTKPFTIPQLEDMMRSIYRPLERCEPQQS
jgi:DNA-binding response OmpR family regulator